LLYADIGGLAMQKQEIRETVELPLTHLDLYQQIGIDLPRGVLFYGPPKTGKTILAKGVAHHTKAAFIAVIGSEFVQKYLGEGPQMVRDTFRSAREHAPAILFINEVDSIATKRFNTEHRSDRELQREGMELLTSVKVIMTTNCGGRLERKRLIISGRNSGNEFESGSGFGMLCCQDG
jgi:26S proteasome regulatory subunit T3